MKKYERRFREIFNLPEGELRFVKHGIWFELSRNPLGGISLEWGIKYEGQMAAVIWYRGKPVFATGDHSRIAVIVFFAEQIGLDTSHPYLQKCKSAAQYEKIVADWQSFIG